MASLSSTRILRGRTDRKETKSFQTYIYPHERKIEICRKFKTAWIKELRKDFFGWLLHEDGRSFRVSLFLDDSDCYMTDGMAASNYFGIQEPTHVVLTYEIYDNNFRVTTFKNDIIESSSSNDLPEGSYQSLETVNGGVEDHDHILEDVDSGKAF